MSNDNHNRISRVKTQNPFNSMVRSLLAVKSRILLEMKIIWPIICSANNCTYVFINKKNS